MGYKLFTIGYEKRSISDYVEQLVKAKVDILVDVRQTAWSYRPEYCKTKFSRKLKAAGIIYLHLPEAGNPKKYRSSTRSIDSCLSLYRNYLTRTKSGLSELKLLIGDEAGMKKRVCLTCYERNHLNCHRSVVVEFLRRRITPLSVVHL